MPPFFRRNIEIFSKLKEGQSFYKNKFQTSKICYFCGKEEIFSMTVPLV